MAVADELLSEYGGEIDDEDGDYVLTDGMKSDGWIYYKVYSVEGDSIRIIKRELDK